MQNIYHSEKMCENTKEKVIKRIEAASILLDIIKKCNLSKETFKNCQNGRTAYYEYCIIS